MQRNPHSYQIATGYRTFYSLSLIYQPITKKRLFLQKKDIISNSGVINMTPSPILQTYNMRFLPKNHKEFEDNPETSL